MQVLTSFITVVLALSVAVERIVEILKQIFGNTRFLRWLFETNSDAAREGLRCAAIHVLSGLIGGLIAYATPIDVLQEVAVADTLPGGWHHAASAVFAGLLASGGSAFWNHALDLLKAAKVQREQDAKSLTALNRAESLRAVANPAAILPNPSQIHL